MWALPCGLLILYTSSFPTQFLPHVKGDYFENFETHSLKNDLSIQIYKIVNTLHQGKIQERKEGNFVWKFTCSILPYPKCVYIYIYMI